MSDGSNKPNLEQLRKMLLAAETEAETLRVTALIAALRDEETKRSSLGVLGGDGLEVVGQAFGPHGNGHLIVKAREGELDKTLQKLDEEHQKGDRVESLKFTDADRKRLGIRTKGEAGTNADGEKDKGQGKGKGKELKHYKGAWADQEARRGKIIDGRHELDEAVRVSRDIDENGGWSRF